MPFLSHLLFERPQARTQLARLGVRCSPLNQYCGQRVGSGKRIAECGGVEDPCPERGDLWGVTDIIAEDWGEPGKITES